MIRRTSDRYTIVISCTSRKPIVLSFRPAIALVILALGVGLPFAAVFTAFSYAQQNTRLAQRNVQLTQEAGNILERLEALETKIGILKDRQDRQGTIRDSSHLNPDPALQTSSLQDKPKTRPEVMLSVARDKIPSLLQLLQRKTLPISEETYLREKARPTGMPIAQKAKISSLFGLRPDGMGWGYELHQGIDFIAPYGSPVYVTAPGTVEKAGWDQSFGNRVVVDHGYGHRTLYAHLEKLVVTEGMVLDRSHIIGYLGSTGRSREPHLHYGVYRNGYVVDPKDYLN
ncbi:MAG: M23 family metallopeptidase [Oscillatoriophycideae cyanobacterium NC_groundwater_1537_Pr4_S-0.65um_50_18]|nr:M23 family metallopeptidase [Oscillatoriophycideae cyanobacterium NC_groundwater_1537_Pr4_S-0.65um_50_18]